MQHWEFTVPFAYDVSPSLSKQIKINVKMYYLSSKGAQVAQGFVLKRPLVLGNEVLRFNPYVFLAFKNSQRVGYDIPYLHIGMSFMYMSAWLRHWAEERISHVLHGRLARTCRWTPSMTIVQHAHFMRA